MANTLTEAVATPRPAKPVVIERTAWRRWLKLVILVVAVLWAANAAISFAVQHTALKRKVTARLETALGRHVEVGSYAISLWGSPTVEARSVTVSDDPRFGYEYFLRAESLTMALRWTSILRGRVEFGAISLTHPSLNLVRDPRGDWNLAEWLPQYSSASGDLATQPAHSMTVSSALRLTRINVDSGRINFKRAQEKLPFALTSVTGYVEPVANGQWRLNLEAQPARAAVILQQAGTLHLSGTVGGTSSRLRPAALDFAWMDASIPDVLRLIHGTDWGVRGNLALAVRATTTADNWNFVGRAEARQVHRWNLPLRADNPSFNVIAEGKLDAQLARFDLVSSTLETLRSNAHATGSIDWNQSAPKYGGVMPHSVLQIASRSLDAHDLLDWARAFHPGISDDLTIRGFAKFDLSLAGWPLRIQEGNFFLGDTDLTGKSLPVPVKLDSVSITYGAMGISSPPTTLSFGSAGGNIRIETLGSLNFGRSATSTPARFATVSQTSSGLRVFGALADVGNLISTVRLLGWDVARGWDLTGPIRGDLKWDAVPYPWKSGPAGSLDFGMPASATSGAEANSQSGDTLRAPFLNLPVEHIRAHLDLKGNTRHLTLVSSEAFGAHWTGSLDRREPVGDQKNTWQFALSADRLSAADMDRWLDPRWRESFLDRVLPFLNSRPPAVAQPENLIAAGKLNVDQFTLVPFMLHRVQGDAAIDGRRFTFSNVRAQLAKGELTGSMRADLTASPSYHISLDYSGVDLYVLTSVSPSLAERFAGASSGSISITAAGTSRSALLSSLQCRGTARIAGAELMSIDLAASLADAKFRPGQSAFRDASADFTCADEKIEFGRLRLTSASEGFAGRGSINFNRQLDFRFSALSDFAAPRLAHVSDSSSYRFTGDLSEPEVALVQSARTNR